MPRNHHHARTRIGAIAGAVAALAVGAVIVVAAPASAHVHVDGDAEPGERATLSFRVPTESDTASTTSVVVTLPTDTPITSVSPQAKPGWEIEVSHVDLDPPVVEGDLTIASAIGSVTWTATDGGIPPGEFDDFVVQLGPIPDVPELVLPARQGYSDGTSVDWSEPSVAGGAEPEHPAPVVAVGSPAAAADGGMTAFGIAGLVVGAVALVVAVLALVAASRRARKG